MSDHQPQLAWHFVNSALRDGRAIPADGEWLEHSGEIVLCLSGLHASLDPWDALSYAPGSVLCLVECAGQIIYSDDKLVCSRRRIVRRLDAEEGLRYFARMLALSAIDCWDAPQVVLDYLMTGDEDIRAAARAAAMSAARAAARAAAMSAARDAARDAAMSAARDAAMSAAWAAARDAAWAAAKDEWRALVAEAFELPSAVFPKVVTNG